MVAERQLCRAVGQIICLPRQPSTGLFLEMAGVETVVGAEKTLNFVPVVGVACDYDGIAAVDVAVAVAVAVAAGPETSLDFLQAAADSYACLHVAVVVHDISRRSLHDFGVFD